MASLLKVIGFIVIAAGLFMSTQVKSSPDGMNYGVIFIIAGVVQGSLFIGIGLVLEKVMQIHNHLIPAVITDESAEETIEPDAAIR